MDDAIGRGRARLASAHKRSRVRERLLAAAVVPISFAAFAPGALAVKHVKHTKHVKNVNFVGTWKVSSGSGFTILKENRKTGVCAGRSSLASSGYKLVACRVRGKSYSFTITYGASYRSLNTGTIKGSTLVGMFKDTNGTQASYTAKRTHG